MYQRFGSTETHDSTISRFDTGTHRSARQPKMLIVADRRDFARDCVTHWLGSLGGEFETLAVANIETVSDDNILNEAAAVLIGIGRSETTDQWLRQQIDWLRERCPEVPITLLLEASSADEATAADTLVSGLGLQGYIPTSTSLSVAAAALRLVVAGGHYFPAFPRLAPPTALSSTGPKLPTVAGQCVAKLTPREEAVLSVLAVGLQNKIIAYQLNMSISTVKAHVHSIISKLKVRNRTEAVVAAGRHYQVNGMPRR